MLRDFSRASFITALIPLMKASLLRLNHSPKAPCNFTLLGIKFQHMNLGEKGTLSLQHPPGLFVLPSSCFPSVWSTLPWIFSWFAAFHLSGLITLSSFRDPLFTFQKKAVPLAPILSITSPHLTFLLVQFYEGPLFT